MNKKILSVSIIFLFLAVGLSGCEEIDYVLGTPEESKNYVVVTVVADICV